MNDFTEQLRTHLMIFWKGLVALGVLVACMMACLIPFIAIEHIFGPPAGVTAMVTVLVVCVAYMLGYQLYD